MAIKRFKTKTKSTSSFFCVVLKRHCRVMEFNVKTKFAGENRKMHM